MPVSTAQARARQACPSLRAAGPVIHCDCPLASAVRPSRLAAIFIRTQGRPRVMREANPIFSSLASSSISPHSKRMPAASSFFPPPAPCGFGSSIAATTRDTSARIRASAQGGVRPVCAQGSSVTYTVAPCALSPAAASALASA
jgi:hypothetical protein